MFRAKLPSLFQTRVKWLISILSELGQCTSQKFPYSTDVPSRNLFFAFFFQQKKFFPFGNTYIISVTHTTYIRHSKPNRIQRTKVSNSLMLPLLLVKAFLSFNDFLLCYRISSYHSWVGYILWDLLWQYPRNSPLLQQCVGNNSLFIPFLLYCTLEDTRLRLQSNRQT